MFNGIRQFQVKQKKHTYNWTNSRRADIARKRVGHVGPNRQVLRPHFGNAIKLTAGAIRMRSRM